MQGRRPQTPFQGRGGEVCRGLRRPAPGEGSSALTPHGSFTLDASTGKAPRQYAVGKESAWLLCPLSPHRTPKGATRHPAPMQPGPRPSPVQASGPWTAGRECPSPGLQGGSRGHSVWNGLAPPWGIGGTGNWHLPPQTWWRLFPWLPRQRPETGGSIIRNLSLSVSHFQSTLFIYFGGGGKRQRETLIGCLLHTPPHRGEHTTQAGALSGNRTGDLSLCRMTPDSLSHAGQGDRNVFRATELGAGGDKSGRRQGRTPLGAAGGAHRPSQLSLQPSGCCRSKQGGAPLVSSATEKRFREGRGHGAPMRPSAPERCARAATRAAGCQLHLQE